MAIFGIGDNLKRGYRLHLLWLIGRSFHGKHFLKSFREEIASIRIDKRGNKSLGVRMKLVKFGEVFRQLIRLNITDTRLIYTGIQNYSNISIASMGIGDTSWESYPMKKTQILKKGKGQCRSCRMVREGRHICRY